MSAPHDARPAWLHAPPILRARRLLPQHRRSSAPTTLLSRVTGLAARHGLFARSFGAGALDGRLPGRVQDPELPAPAVRRGRVLAGLRARSSPSTRCQAQPRRGARAGRRRRRHARRRSCASSRSSASSRRRCSSCCSRPGFARTAATVRARGRDAALDVPVPVLHLADRARRRRAQQLRASSRCPRSRRRDQRRHDRVRGLDRAAFRAARRRARDRRVRRAASCSSRSRCPFMLRLGLLRRPRWRCEHEGVRRIGRLMLPGDLRLVGGAGQPAARHADRVASSSPAASPWLYYADRLMEFPLGVFSIALATVILPGLSAHHAAAVAGAIHRDARLGAAARRSWSCCRRRSALLVLAGPLTVAIFHYGAFDEHDVRMATLALMAYSLGPARLQPGEGAGAGLLRAPGHADAGARRHAVAGRQHGLNVAIVLPLALTHSTARVCTCCSRSTTASAPGQRDAAVARPARGRASTAARRAGGACCVQIVIAQRR